MHKYMYMIRPHLEQLMGRIGTFHDEKVAITQLSVTAPKNFLKGIGSVYKRHPVTKFEHGSHGASKRKFNHMTVY